MLFWKKMPSLWIGNQIAEFSDLDTAKAIAALKIYLTFCLFCKESDSGCRTVKLTFSDICETASMSRSLVNEGLKILYAKKLIKNVSQTERKKIYTVDVLGPHEDGWCKLPLKGVVGEDNKISAFQSMHNRYPFELLALQTYMMHNPIDGPTMGYRWTTVQLHWAKDRPARCYSLFHNEFESFHDNDII